jgi:hypothetical protein
MSRYSLSGCPPDHDDYETNDDDNFYESVLMIVHGNDTRTRSLRIPYCTYSSVCILCVIVSYSACRVLAYQKRRTLP